MNGEDPGSRPVEVAQGTQSEDAAMEQAKLAGKRTTDEHDEPSILAKQAFTDHAKRCRTGKEKP